MYTGLVAFLKQAIRDGFDRNAFIDHHCIVHQENLCAKALRFDAVIKVVNDVLKFIRALALNHRQFQNFLTAKREAHHGDAIYQCHVRWLNRAKAPKRIAELKVAIQEFMTMKNDKPIFEFDDPQFMADFGFLADISSYLATVNLKLPQKGQQTHVLFSHVKTFQAKLKLFKQLIGDKDLNHLPVMAHMNCKEYSPNFVKCISELQNTFNERFHDFGL